jgi:drug/metabolite transporter (DMT)-like permease
VAQVGRSPTNAVARPSSHDLILLITGVCAVSTSGPLIAATIAPALAIAFWRNALATGVIAPFAVFRRRAEFASLSRREWQMSVAAGGFLALHFATWVPSLDYTSVASSTAIVASQPVFAALLARRRGHDVPGRAWVGMAVAFTGVLVISGVDFTLSSRALFGDALALVGAAFAAAYVTMGSSARRTVTTTTYTFIVYGVTSLILLAFCLIGRQPLTGYSSGTWTKLVLLTVLAQLLGHSVFNIALRTTPPTVASLAILFEMPGAALIAAVWLGQIPPFGVLPGAALLLTGVGIVVWAGSVPAASSLPVD